MKRELIITKRYGDNTKKNYKRKKETEYCAIVSVVFQVKFIISYHCYITYYIRAL
jgi:hypothetical protein